MRHFNRTQLRLVAAASAAAMMAGIAPPSRASIWIGLGGDNKFSTPGNWDVVPVAGSPLVFDGGINLSPFNDLAPGLVFGGITFNAGAGPFNLTGAEFDPGGDIVNNSGALQTISLNLALAANRQLSVAPGGTLAINGVVSAPGFGMTLGGGGTLRMGATCLTPGDMFLNGGRLIYLADNHALQTLSYGTTVTTAAASVSTFASSAELIDADATTTALLFQTNNPSSALNTMTIGAGKTLTVNGPVTVGVSSVYTNTQAAGDPQMLTNAAISGAGSLVVNGGTNSFVVAVNRSNTPSNPDPQATLDLSGLSHFKFSSTGELRVGSGGNVAGTLKLASVGNAITASAVQVAASNNLNNGGTSRLTLGDGTNSLIANVFVVGAGKSPGTISFAGMTGDLKLAGSADGQVPAESILVGSASSTTASSSTSGLVLAGHTVDVNVSTLIMGRMAQTASGGIGAGFVSFDTGTMNVGSLIFGHVVNGTAPNGAVGTFQLGSSSLSTGVLNVAKTVLLGQNISTNAVGIPAKANFLINGGIANINGDVTIMNTSPAGTVAGTIALAGGVLNMMGHQIGTGTPSINMVFPAAGQSATLANLGGTGINGAGLTMDGAGTLALDGTNTYSGPTRVAAGRLLVNGTHTGGGEYTVQSGGVLGGSGNIGSTVNIMAGGSYAPGSSIDQQDITGDLNISGTWQIEYDGVLNVIDRSDVTGQLNLSGATLNFLDLAGGDLLDLPAYVFASYGTLIGTPQFEVGVPAGYRVEYAYFDGSSSNRLALVVPEPAMVALGSIGLLVLMRRRRLDARKS